MSYFPCDEDVNLINLVSGLGCDEKGLTGAYVQGRKRIDIATMNDAPSNFIDPTGCQIVDFAMKTDLDTTQPYKFLELSFNIEESFYNSNKADENAEVYVHTLTSVLTGKSPEQTCAFKRLASQCGGLIVVVFTNSCQGRVFGIEYNSKAGKFEFYLKGMKLGRHDDTHGQFGQEGDARDDFDLVGRSRGPALWIDGDEQAFRTAYVL